MFSSALKARLPRSLALAAEKRLSPLVIGPRAYHSYPDPNEKPQISTAKSTVAKQIDKSSGLFDLDPKFKLHTTFPGITLGKPIKDTTTPKTLSTRLGNELTVATQENPGLMTSLAFVVRTGSAYETQKSAGPDNDTGATHFLELNAFRSTNKRDHQTLVTEVERLGGMVQCIATRENILYCIDVLKENAEQALGILAETIMEPVFPEHELEESRHIVELQQTELPSDVFSKDIVQRAAYQGYPLSNHHFCPLDRANTVTAQVLHDFRKKHFFGANCVLSGVGIDHDHLVSLAKKRFSAMREGSRENVQRAPSAYTGGMLTQERELKEPFVRLAMAFEVGGWKSPDLVPVCVLQQLLGGGSSFSAGGPGKGMYTRLYTQVLNMYHWAESVEAFVSIHEEQGLLGIDGSCPPEHLAGLVRVIVDQFSRLAHNPVTAEELSRAKNMLKSMMMMQLESRLVVCEDIARQFTTYGFREAPEVICAKIDAVTEKDLMRVASLMLEVPPSVGVVGHDLSQLPDYDQIKTFTQQYSHQVWLQASRSNNN